MTLRATLVAVLGVAACASPPPAKPETTVVPRARAAVDASVAEGRLERMTAANAGRLERVRGTETGIAHVEHLRDGTILVDRFDELELVDRKQKTLARLPIDARVDKNSRSESTGAWAISSDTGLEVAIVRVLPQWSGVVVYKTDGSEQARYPVANLGPAPAILSVNRERIALGDAGQKLLLLDRNTGKSGDEIKLTAPPRFRKDGNAIVVDRGSGEAEVKSFVAGAPSAQIRYRKGALDGSFHAGMLSLSDDGRTLVAGEISDADVIDLASKKTAKVSATFLGDYWGRADKIAVVGPGSVGLVDRATPSKVEWKKIPGFRCKAKKTPCDDRDVKWTDLRFTAASAEWPTVFGTAAGSMVLWYPGKRVRVLSPDDHDFASAELAPDGRHVIEFEQGAAYVARVLKVPEPDVDAPTDHWPVIVPTEPDVVRGVFSPDGKAVALSNDRTWKVWSLETGRLIAMNAKPKPHLSSGTAVAPSDFDDPLVREMFLGARSTIGARRGSLTLRLSETRDKARNVVTTTDVELFDVRSESVVWRGNMKGFARAWAIDEGGKHVAASLQASKSGFFLFDTSKEEPVEVPTTAWVHDLTFFGSRIVGSTNGHELFGIDGAKRWSTTEAQCSGLKDPALRAAGNGTKVIVGVSKRCIFDVETGAFIAEVGVDDTSELARISPDTTELYAYGNGVLSRWDAMTGKLLATAKLDLIDGLGRSRRPIAYTSDGMHILVAAKDSIVTFDRKTGAEVARMAWPAPMSIAVTSGKERLVAVTDFHGRGAILDASGNERARFFCPEKNGNFNVPEWSADERSLTCLKASYSGEPLEAGYVFVVR